jgi:hypothetical protein
VAIQAKRTSVRPNVIIIDQSTCQVYDGPRRESRLCSASRSASWCWLR